MTSPHPILDAIKKRRVTRSFDDKPVATEQLEQVLVAARWASSAGGNRLHKYVVVNDEDTIRQVRLISPGMLAVPTALIVICTDFTVCAERGVQVSRDVTLGMDVGTAAMTMMLAAQELGLGTCPTTSFSASGMSAVLGLGDGLRPEMYLQVGVPIARERTLRTQATTILRPSDLSIWHKPSASAD